MKLQTVLSTARDFPQLEPSWARWQAAVIELLRADFTEALHHIQFDEVDWDSWRFYYEEGRTPRQAVDRALERDF